MYSDGVATARCPTAGFNPVVDTNTAFTSHTEKKPSPPVFFTLKIKELTLRQHLSKPWATMQCDGLGLLPSGDLW